MSEPSKHLDAETLAWIDAFVDSAPPLTPEKHDRLWGLLRPPIADEAEA